MIDLENYKMIVDGYKKAEEDYELVKLSMIGAIRSAIQELSYDFGVVSVNQICMGKYIVLPGRTHKLTDEEIISEIDKLTESITKGVIKPNFYKELLEVFGDDSLKLFEKSIQNLPTYPIGRHLMKVMTPIVPIMIPWKKSLTQQQGMWFTKFYPQTFQTPKLKCWIPI